MDADERLFEAERAGFTGAPASDDWAWLDGPGGLDALAGKHCKRPA